MEFNIWFFLIGLWLSTFFIRKEFYRNLSFNFLNYRFNFIFVIEKPKQRDFAISLTIDKYYFLFNLSLWSIIFSFSVELFDVSDLKEVKEIKQILTYERFYREPDGYLYDCEIEYTDGTTGIEELEETKFKTIPIKNYHKN